VTAERLESVHRALRRTAALEVSQLERYLPFLATTASATPFIGLFGTVWGVMAAFHGIGSQGSASLAVVAPGISEALIATAAGLAAAIPAVIGYNYFVNRVKHWATEMEGFILDLLNLLSRPAPKIGRPAKDGI
jgi:biopolymer transport protein TolQ